ncbi:MAG: hypothetical protein AAGC55_30040, partial [Myxococcota bacterium]
EQPPLLRSVVPSAPGELEEIIGHTLIKDPAGRYASMRQLRQDLEAIQAGRRPTGPQAVPSSSGAQVPQSGHQNMPTAHLSSPRTEPSTAEKQGLIIALTVVALVIVACVILAFVV